MRAIHRKLLRDLVHLRWQLVTIALVVESGIAGYVTMATAERAIERSRDAYYEASRFADVFARCKRAPMSAAGDLETIPGAATVEVRAVGDGLVPLDDLAEPASLRLVSIPDEGEPRLNALHLRNGRLPDLARSDEVVLHEAFARAHGIEPGATLPIVVEGVRRDVRVVGVALSPEYVMPISNRGTFDDRRFAIVWMRRRALAPTLGLDGAFDDVTIRLQHGASERAVLEALDRSLARYGGFGAMGRARQLSSSVVEDELVQLRTYAWIGPAIFLGVSAFLLNVVLSRLVHLQRPEIATLRAIGYSRGEVAAFFARLVGIVVLVGAAIGTAFGGWLGGGMTSLYGRYFRFPDLAHRIDLDVLATAIAVSAVAGAAGAALAMTRLVRLTPAEAMQPETPPLYHRSFFDRVLSFLLGPATRMIAREISRRPVRFALSSFAVALAMGVTAVARFSFDAVDAFFDTEFEMAEREDVALTMRNPVSCGTRRALEDLPGVLEVETRRNVPVRARSGARYRDVVLVGHEPNEHLRRVVVWPPAAVAVPEDGAIVTRKLAEILGANVGSSLDLEALEGARRRISVPIVGVVDEMAGLSVHMSATGLARALREDDAFDAAYLRIDSASLDRVETALRELPVVAGFTRRETTIAQIQKQTGETNVVTAVILTAFAVTIAIGVVYNNARIALSMRSRDLASLRVLGFTRGEISQILLGELGAQVFVGVPMGIPIGRVLVGIVASTVYPEVFRLPPVVSITSYALAAFVTIAAAAASALLVRRKLDELDLVAVLKVRQ